MGIVELACIFEMKLISSITCFYRQPIPKKKKTDVFNLFLFNVGRISQGFYYGKRVNILTFTCKDSI